MFVLIVLFGAKLRINLKNVQISCGQMEKGNKLITSLLPFFIGGRYRQLFIFSIP